MKTHPIKDLIESIKSLANTGARFVSLRYTSKGSGETAVHNVLLGVNLVRAYKRDLAILRAKLPKLTGIDAQACGEMIASLAKSLEVGIGNNPAYTQKDTYVTIAPGVKLDPENGSLYVYGFSMGKTVLVPGEHKHVNSQPKTLAKKKLGKLLKSTKFRQYAVSELSVAKLDGRKLVFA